MNTPRYTTQGDLVIDSLLLRQTQCSNTWGAADIASELNSGTRTDANWGLPAGVARYYVSKNTNGQDIIVDRLEAKFLHMPDFEQLEYAYEILTGSRQWEDGCKHWYWEAINASALAKPALQDRYTPCLILDGGDVPSNGIFDRKTKLVASIGKNASLHTGQCAKRLNSGDTAPENFRWDSMLGSVEIVVPDDECAPVTAPKQQPFFYVFRENGDKPRVQHVSFDLAQKEAERIAGTCDDRVFVLKAISVSKRQTKVNTQELA